MLDIEDAWRGTMRQVVLRSPRLNDQTRVTTAERTIDANIPRGVRLDQTMRPARQGGPAAGSAPAGDLLPEVSFWPHPRYPPDGADLQSQPPVAAWDAALGAVVPVALPDGTTLVRVPANAQSGRAVVVRGKGLPARDLGDLRLNSRLVLSSADDPHKATYETVAAEFAEFDACKLAAAGAKQEEAP